MPLQVVLLLLFYLPHIVGAEVSEFPLASAGGQGGVFWIKNEGQWPGDFQFKCEIGNTTYYVTPKGMTVDFREVSEIVAPSLVGKNPQVPFDPSVVILNEVKDPSEKPVKLRGHVIQIHYSQTSRRQVSSPAPPTENVRGENLLPHYSNYFLGRDSTNWRSRVPHYQTVIAEEVWPGIDVEYRADKQGVETIYHVAPGADPAQIQMEYLGLDAPLRIDARGNLVLTTSRGEVKEQAPYAYQINGRTQKRIESTYRLIDNNRVAFEFEGFDASRELVIDPLLYGTYLGGGSTDEGGPLTPAPDGGVYVAGSTYAMSGFPTTPGAYDETGIFPGYRDFVSHFNAVGEFIASTLYGEIQTSENRNTEGGAYDLVFDLSRNALWICGVAYPDWPITPFAFDTSVGGSYDGFFMRLSSDLTELEYCSYLGGDRGDQAREIELDSLGYVLICGETASTDFPISSDALFPSIQGGDGFLWTYDPNLNEMRFSTYFGGERFDLFWSLSLTNDHVWLAGQTNSARLPVTENAFKIEFSDTGEFDSPDAFLALLTLNPPAVEYCSYLGGDGFDHLYCLMEADSHVYLAGNTFSWNFPISSGVVDTIGPLEPGDPREGFVARLNWETGDYIGTFIGGDEFEFIDCHGEWVGVDYVLITGSTGSAGFPVTEGAYDSVLNDGTSNHGDGFITKLSRDLTEILYSSYIGGSHDDSYVGYVENSDSLWLSGTTLSTNLPATPDAFQPGDNALTSAFLQHFAIDTTASTASEHRAVLPNKLSLSAFPNPFNPSTTLAFDLQKPGPIDITVYDLLGREVSTRRFDWLPLGSHTYRFQADQLPSGIYFAKLTGQKTETIAKLILIR